MAKFQDNMTEIFDLPEEDYESNLPAEAAVEGELMPSKKVISEKAKELEEDYRYSRELLKNTIDDARVQLAEISRVADATEQPRAYEVVAKLIDTIAAAQKDLIDLHKNMQSLTGEKADNKPTKVTNNAVFVGSTKDLSEAIKKLSADK